MFYVMREVQRTLGIIKPDAVEKADEIFERIRKEGFAVLSKKRVRVVLVNEVVIHFNS